MTANPCSWIWLLLVENPGACAKIIIHFGFSVIHGQIQCCCVSGWFMGYVHQTECLDKDVIYDICCILKGASYNCV